MIYGTPVYRPVVRAEVRRGSNACARILTMFHFAHRTCECVCKRFRAHKHSESKLPQSFNAKKGARKYTHTYAHILCLYVLGNRVPVIQVELVHMCDDMLPTRAHTHTLAFTGIYVFGDTEYTGIHMYTPAMPANNRGMLYVMCASVPQRVCVCAYAPKHKSA